VLFIETFSYKGLKTLLYAGFEGNAFNIASIVFPENPPWLNPKLIFNFELTKYKNSETNPLLIQQHFAEIRSVTSEYSESRSIVYMSLGIHVKMTCLPISTRLS
jgi:hypothetical protein